MASYNLEGKGVDLSVLLRSLEEIELLKLKYENLVSVCEHLLKPWYNIQVNSVRYLSSC